MGVKIILAFIMITLISCKKPVHEVEPIEKESKTQGPTFRMGDTQGAALPQIAYFVRNILEDSNHNLWFGTNQFGVAHYDGKDLTYYSIKEGLSGDQVTSIIEDSNKNIWFTTNGGVSMFDGKNFINYSVTDGVPGKWAWSILQDSKDVIWVGTLEGLATFDGEKFTEFKLPPSKVSNPEGVLDTRRINYIFEDTNNNLWFATDGNGVYKYDRKEFTNLTKEAGLCDNNITTIIEDHDNNIWFGSMFGGLCKYRSGSFTTISTKDNVIGDDEVIKIYEDSKKNIWFSSEGFGVYRIDGTQLTNYSKNEGLDSGALQTIFEDSNGNFLFGGSGGLYKFDDGKFQNISRLDMSKLNW